MAQAGVSAYAAEFVGTFLLVFTVGCNVLSQHANWGGLSIACSLMVGIYALGGVSGANFNPAVSVALGAAGKMEEGFKQVAVYSGVQILAGCCAAVAYSMLFGDSFNLGPAEGYDWWQAMLCEFFYTFVLCFVVLNCAASKKIGGKNQFYGLAIGFVIVAGAYGSGAVSGGCFNPAVAIAIDVLSIGKGFGWCILYSFCEILGAAAAVLLFKFVRPEECDESNPPETYPLQSKLAAEMIGTFVLVVTVGMNVLVDSKAAAFSIAAALMAMIYALGDVSGANFNPAVTLAILCSGREKTDLKEACQYMVSQVAAGMYAAFFYEVVQSGRTFPLGPGKGFDWGGVAVAEIFFTFVLCFVVLSVATVLRNPAPEMTGFIIGMCITVGGLAIGQISGGSLNPAVSIGVATARKVIGDGRLQAGFLYTGLEFIGAVLAAGSFRIVHADEYIKD